jgi:hypothetical protein
MSPDQANRLLAEAELVHAEPVIQEALERVAGAIRERLAGRHPLVLCVMTGGVIFCPSTAAAGSIFARFRLPATRPATAPKRRRQDFLAHGAVDLGQGGTRS